MVKSIKQKKCLKYETITTIIVIIVSSQLFLVHCTNFSIPSHVRPSMIHFELHHLEYQNTHRASKVRFKLVQWKLLWLRWRTMVSLNPLQMDDHVIFKRENAGYDDNYDDGLRWPGARENKRRKHQEERKKENDLNPWKLGNRKAVSKKIDEDKFVIISYKIIPKSVIYPCFQIFSNTLSFGKFTKLRID